MAANKFGKYQIKNVGSVSVGGRKVVAKEGVFELTEAEAEHLGGVYHVTEVEGARVGEGQAHAVTAGEAKKDDFYAALKADLLTQERDLLEKKAESLQVTVDDKMAVGDIVAAIISKMQTIGGLKVATEPSRRATARGRQ